MISIFQYAHQLALTSTETEILNWMEQHVNACLHMNLKDLSKELYTSNATIVRFCQKLGFRGFNEFRYQLRQQLKQENTSLLFSDDIITHSLALFRDNLEQQDFAALHETADLLTSGQPVYIYGSGFSSLPAHYLHIVLSSLDYSCILVEWQKLLNTLISELSNDSVLLLISTHAEPLIYRPILETARKSGVKTILLTSNSDTELHSLCTYHFYSNDPDWNYREGSLNPRIGIFTIVQLLIEMIANKAL